ncbi:hypothetical protein Tco_0656519 [Tanacetum coccineum]|uniref:Uncharacterized protein n=1 Tax=Tanacetum coccineum TaxID=301880 RepID=A0ABQ4XA64_9ASTR
MMTSKLPSSMDISSMLDGWFKKIFRWDDVTYKSKKAVDTTLLLVSSHEFFLPSLSDSMILVPQPWTLTLEMSLSTTSETDYCRNGCPTILFHVANSLAVVALHSAWSSMVQPTLVAKIKDVKVEDVSLAYDTSLEVFNNEVNRLNGMNDDLFTYEVKVANIPCDSKMDDDSEHEADDDMGYDPSDVAFTEWLGLKFFNYKTMDHYTMKALWIYWIRGDDEVELTDEESSNDKDDVAEVFRIDTNLFNFETPMCEAFKEFNYLLQINPDLLTKDIEGFKTFEDYKDDWIYEWNKDVPWVDEKPWTNAGVWTKPTPVKHTCKPFNYKTGCSEWPTCSWKDDGYCNGGNLPGTYIIGNQLHYQDYEWYEALEDSELKNKALRNKAIMEGFINEDDDVSRPWKQRISTNIDGEFTNLEILKCWSFETSRRLFNTQSAHKLKLENLPSKYQRSFSF